MSYADETLSTIENNRVPSLEGRLTVSVVIAMFNEEKTIATVIERLLALTDVSLQEIVVVDDGSIDDSAAIVRAIAAKHQRVELICLEHNSGKTKAIATAIAVVSGDIVFLHDADLEYDPSDISSVIKPIIDGQADVVYGSRNLKGHSIRAMQYVGNRVITLLSNLLTHRNMSDIETCYKALRTGLIKPLRFTSDRFGLEVEITALVCKTNARILEVPICYNPRTYDQGKKIGAWDGLMAVAYIVYYNLIAPRLASGKRFIREANCSLDQSADSIGRYFRQSSEM